MKRRRYRDADDVAALQAFNAAAIAETSGCGFLHPGDIPHRLFNGNKLFDPAEVLTIWEDGRGIAAWVLVSAGHRGFDAQVRPDLRGGAFERDVLRYGETEIVRLAHHHEIECDRLVDTPFRDDVVRIGLLAELGWRRDGEPPWALNERSLTALEDPVVPEGYAVRSVRGVAEAGVVAEVHAASFGSEWTAGLYRKVMESPGYEPEREFVVETERGSLAAFTVTWLDRVNQTGLFEPVGTHRDHRRRGLGKALLLFAMRRMAEAGMSRAQVVNEGTNPASAALYRSAGFSPRYLLDGYTKPIPG